MIVQVFLYPWIEENLVLAKAKDVDPDAVRKNFTPLDVPLKNGDKVTAHLQMSGKGLELTETDIDKENDHYETRDLHRCIRRSFLYRYARQG